MSNAKATAIFPSSSGSIDDIKERVITALISYLGYVYCWPKDDERKEIASVFENKFFINDCVGVADGTLLPLGFRPQRDDAADFHGRKLAYTITMLIICDHKKRIRYYHAGWPGNVHDERVFRNTRICQQPHNYFSNNQYLLSDSAISPRDFVVPQYKYLTEDGIMSIEEMQFNSICSTPRVIVEHCIGQLKSRFPFLRNIRLRITEDVESIRRVQRYIRVCVILHNLLIGFNDEQFEIDKEEIREHSTDDENSDKFNFINPETNGIGGDHREQLDLHLQRIDAYTIRMCNRW